MKNVFIDTSALAALLFDEPSASDLHRHLKKFERISASNLLEAEIRAAASREGVDQGDVDKALSQVEWVLPDRPLSQELRSIANCGVFLRGADAWHIACALYFAGDPSLLPFITLDEAQGMAASRLGFTVLPGNQLSSGGARETQATYKPNTRISKRKREVQKAYRKYFKRSRKNENKT